MTAIRFASIVATVLLVSTSPAHAITYVWDMDCSEDQVSNSGLGDGSTDSTATGHASVRYDTLTERMSYDISWNGLEGDLSAIHIHGPAAPLANNNQHIFNVYTAEPDVIAAGVDRTSDNVTATDTLFHFIFNSSGSHLPADALQMMIDEMAYVNIHSTMWPAGEIRCHFMLVDTIVDAEQTKAQQRCTGVSLKGLPKVSGAKSKQLLGCISDRTKGKLSGTTEQCITEDEKQKIAGAVGKVEDGFAKFCTGLDKDGISTLPSYGVTSSINIANAVDASWPALFHALFGADLDVAIDDSSDPVRGKCQASAATAASRCYAARLKEFAKCVKGDLAGKQGLTIVDTAGFQECLWRDAKGKVAKACNADSGKVRQTLDKRCAGVDLSVAVGGCGSAAPEVTAACVETGSRCGMCLAGGVVHGFSANCDLDDDGLANGSCPSLGP